MSSPVTIRPFDEADYAAVAGLYKRSPSADRQDFEPTSEGALRGFDACFDPSRDVIQRFVAEGERSGELVGAAHFFSMPWIADRSRYWCAVRVDPSRRREGIGGRLYAHVMDELARRGATAVRMMARETTPELASALSRRGYVEVMRSWDFELEIAEAKSPPEPKRAGPPVLPMPLLDAIAREPAWAEKLNALYRAVMKDVPIPGVPRADLPASWLADHLLRWPTSLPEACLVVVEDGAFVGLSVAHRDEDDPSKMNQLLTGVAKAMRGRGVGAALKRASIEAASRLGYRRIWTGVESNNPKMLAINEAFGFVRTGGLILFEKILGQNGRIVRTGGAAE